MPLNELSDRIEALALAGTAQPVPVCPSQPDREVASIRGEVRAGEQFEAETGSFLFRLRPYETGWLISVYEPDRDDELSHLTPPWHFVPTPRDIQGWHFRNVDNTGPNDGTVNAPQERREFIFSPEVGRTIEYRGSGTSAEDVERVKAFGRGELTILDYQLTPPQRGGSARLLRMKFDVCMSWPSGK